MSVGVPGDKTPTWVDGIGPPLEQLAEDCREMLAYAKESGDEARGYKDTLALIAEVARLSEERDRLRDALQGVQWIWDASIHDYYCPACGRRDGIGHSASCSIGSALASVGADGE